MARADDLGFFWEDLAKVKVIKEPPPKRTPPERTWEHPDYLPGLEEALTFNFNLFTDEELMQAAQNGEILDVDCEVYRNYFLAMFTSTISGKCVFIEKWFDQINECDTYFDNVKLRWILESFCTQGFNSNKYDLPILAYALSGKTCSQIKDVSDEIIQTETPGYTVLRYKKVKQLKGIDHIDYIEVAPSFCSLKQYAGRMHAKRMQDLPFPPDTILSENQIAIIRWYCRNDLSNTALLAQQLSKQIDLRVTISNEQKTDVRSKSDPQIAEVVIENALRRRGHGRIKVPSIEIGTQYKYKLPRTIKFESELLNHVVDVILDSDFYVGENGSIGMPAQVKELKIQIGDSVYQMGIGGLHSTEKSVAYIADENLLILDRDVDSFYPKIIQNLGLYPEHIGVDFLNVYCGEIVDRRLKAKREKRKTESDTLKITANGTFGKHGSKYSIVYAPMNVVQITISGQLFVLMLIERFELAGIKVVSANTDGVVFLCPADRYEEVNAIVAQWEKETDFTTEETRYRALYSRDINNYIALKAGGGHKGKGAYANPWNVATLDLNEQLKHNPANLICLNAVVAYLEKGTPVSETILTCADITQFVTVRNAAGGAVKDGVYLGKVIRWYYAKDQAGEIIYAKNGNKVARSDGAKPLMTLPNSLPEDINFDWYVEEATKILAELNPNNLTCFNL